MKLGEHWLRELADPALDAAALCEALTLGGLEVEACAPACAPVTGVVVGEVSAVAAHPAADHLRVCTVFDGAQPHQVVCGAPNVRVGMRSAYARVGAVIAGGQPIARQTLRGVESAGMLCSARELGLGEDAVGVVDFGDEARIGAPLDAFLDLDENVLEISLTPNRGDCFSVLGIARDIAALTGCEMRSPTVASVAPRCVDEVAVDLEAPAGCPRYAGRVIRHINPRASTPWWMRERLRRAGVRAIHPVVDVTNYVMLELGQPMHAFDLARLAPPIVVRGAVAGEHITLLDDSRIELAAGTLLITDRRGPIALAGVMGGAHTAVGDATTDIFLESAFFTPLQIASSARGHRLQTDASQRFERGVDPSAQVRAIERATRLLVDICGGDPGPVCLTESVPPARRTLDFRPQAVARLLGVDYAESDMLAVFAALGLEVVPGSETWGVTVPGYRFDLALEADLIEEVARVRGFHTIPSRLPRAANRPVLLAPGRRRQQRVRGLLAARGYHETITYSFVDPKSADAFTPGEQRCELLNPIASDLAVMRRSLWPGLMQAARQNLNRQHHELKLFEFGVVFHPRGAELVEHEYCAGLRYGTAALERWSEERRDGDFYDLKQDVEEVLGALGTGSLRFEVATHPALHPGQCAMVLSGERRVAVLGALSPALQRQFELPKALYLFEIEAWSRDDERATEFEPISRFPAVRRDLSIIVTESVSAAHCLSVVQEAAGRHLRNLELLDVYRGQGIDSGKKSFTLGLIFQALSSTLTDDEVDGAVVRVLDALREHVGGSLRK